MKIKIFDLTFEVVEVSAGDPLLEGNIGIFDLRHQRIIICKNLSCELYFNTLVHESIHGVLTAIGDRRRRGDGKPYHNVCFNAPEAKQKDNFEASRIQINCSVVSRLFSLLNLSGELSLFAYGN